MGGLMVKDMLTGRASQGTGPVPTQTFYAANVGGGPIPRVGAVQGTSGVALGSQFATINPQHIVIIVLILIGAGYLFHHLTFEESVGARGGASASAGESLKG